MRVQQVDPCDDAAYAAWFAVVDAALEHARPGEPHWTAGEQREIALEQLDPASPSGGVLLAAAVDDAVVGAARLDLPRRDHLEVADLVLEVHPGHRRRGIGSALLAAAVRRARDAGRRVVTGEVDEPGQAAAGRGFAERVGARCGLVETRRDLRLPPDEQRLAALETASLPYAEGYQIRTWRDRTPEELLAGRADLLRRLSTDAPSGDQPWEEERWDGERVRAHERLTAAQGRASFLAGALYDGQLVAYTELTVPLAVPETAYQDGTLVVPEHRGHRLGALVKLAALRELAQASPSTRRISTWNAETNRPMVAVNEALGFVPNGRLSLWSLTTAR